MALLGDILKSAIPLVHDLTDGTTITLHSGSGSEFDPDTLGVSPGAGATMTVPCSSPWPYRARGVEVESGLMQVSMDGSRPELTARPDVGMIGVVDGKTYAVVEAQHDLDGNDWILLLKGAG